MANYLRFETTDGDILVETDASAVEPASETGEQQAGLKSWVRGQAGEAVAVAQTEFEQAMRRTVGVHARAFLVAANALENPPAEMEIAFGLKGTGEVGKVAVGKVAGECSYQVRMVWRRP